MWKLIFVLFVISKISFAMSVENKEGNFFLIDEKRRFEILSSGGEPKFIKEEKINDQLYLLIYLSGVAGTSMPVEITRAIIVKKEKDEFKGDFIYSLKFPPKKTGRQPHWDFSIPGTVSIITSDGILKKIFY